VGEEQGKAMFVLKSVIFVVVTVLLVAVSVRRPSRHGLFRLLAWESLVVLILLNLNH
jgi:hypothetical protein